MCVDCVLASPRIAQADPGRRTPPRGASVTVDGRGIEEDVVGKVIELQGEQNLIAPAGVAYRRRIQNSQDNRVNVLYPAGLRM
jgi:hypothetical protein